MVLDSPSPNASVSVLIRLCNSSTHSNESFYLLKAERRDLSEKAVTLESKVRSSWAKESRNRKRQRQFIFVLLWGKMKPTAEADRIRGREKVYKIQWAPCRGLGRSLRRVLWRKYHCFSFLFGFSSFTPIEIRIRFEFYFKLNN